MPFPLNAQPSVRLTATAAVTSLFCPWPTWRTRCQPAAGGAAAGDPHPAATSPAAASAPVARSAAARNAVLPRMRPLPVPAPGRPGGTPRRVPPLRLPRRLAGGANRGNEGITVLPGRYFQAGPLELGPGPAQHVAQDLLDL